MATTFTRNTTYTNTRTIAVLINRKGYELPEGCTFTFTGEYDKRTQRAAFKLSTLPETTNVLFTDGAELIFEGQDIVFRTNVHEAIASLSADEPTTEDVAANTPDPIRQLEEKVTPTKRETKYQYPANVTTKAQKKAFRHKARQAAKKAKK